ncbi:hypothetical protein [Cryobacterium lyxosi]|uniref:Uncharacterized protein n=1 Tax=Cryobacterium lyxosi TaxID=1259228 RepID=A0A4R8ZGY5_9MICO|nr:hypothetical protein [Cryobacterium lyxosi]TFD25867.1 hypothetical protein E3T27_08665 [Cryobacterium lyxosi]
MSITTSSRGWPADHGPLVTLIALGLHDDPTQRPNWLHYPRTETRERVESYHASTKYLNRHSLRALASLTLEGWLVYIDPEIEHASLRIKVMAEHATTFHPTEQDQEIKE